jgi:hypothetical protein
MAKNTTSQAVQLDENPDDCFWQSTCAEVFDPTKWRNHKKRSKATLSHLFRHQKLSGPLHLKGTLSLCLETLNL